MKGELAKLRQANVRLRAEISQLHEQFEDNSIQPKKGKGASIANATLRAQVKELKAEIYKLKKVCQPVLTRLSRS